MNQPKKFQKFKNHKIKQHFYKMTYTIMKTSQRKDKKQKLETKALLLQKAITNNLRKNLDQQASQANKKEQEKKRKLDKKGIL